MSMTFKQFLMNEGVADLAKQSEAALQAVWAERDPERKYELAKSFIENMKFKDKMDKDLRDLERIRNNPNKIDSFISNIQMKGEGHGVVR